MFFVLSKTLGIMALPLNFLIGLSVLGSLLLLTRFLRLGRALVFLSALMLAACGFGPVGNLLLYPLESRFPAWTPSQSSPDGIIVLGASIDIDMSAAHGTPVVRPRPTGSSSPLRWLGNIPKRAWSLRVAAPI